MSEKESSSLSKFIDKFKNIKLYISFHSYGQYLMFPYVSIRCCQRCKWSQLAFQIKLVHLQGYKSGHVPNHDDLVSPSLEAWRSYFLIIHKL